jgi:zinc protease
MHNPIQAKSPLEKPTAVQFPRVSAHTRTLPNGLGVIVQEDHSSPVASVQVWVETGSIHESQHTGAGMSHMLEHMLFKGTATRTCSEFAQRVQDAGGYINAYTSFDRTVYWIDIPAKGVATALELLSDAVLNSTLPPEEFVKEQEVIRREFAMGYDDPDRMSGITLFATAYRDHPYQHPVIGHLDVFDAVTRDEVMAYYKARYVPNNMFFVVAGDVDADAVYTQIEALFAGRPRAALPPVFIPQEPPQLGRRELHREFATELTRMHLAWHVPDATHPDIAVLDVLAMVLGHGRSARLYRKLREELALVHGVDAWCYAPGQAGLWGVDAVLDPEKREQVQEEILRALDELRVAGPTVAELEKAKRQSLSHQLQAVTTMRGKASDLGSNWLLTRNLDFSRDYLAAIQKVTVDDVRRVVGTWLIDRNLTVVSLNPAGFAQKRAAPESVAVGGEIQSFELSNGLRLLVREDSRLPLVSIVAAFKGGLLAETPQENGLTRLFSKVLLKGTEGRTAEQLADEIEAVGGSISSDAGNNSVSVFLRVMDPDVTLGFDILSDVLCRPTLPEKAIIREKEVQLASIKADEEEMTSVARNLMRSNLFPDHPYGLRSLGTPESVARLDQSHLRAYHEQYLVARNGVIAVFGNVKASEIRQLAEQALSGLPSGEPAFQELRQPVAPTRELHVEEHRDKTQAVLMVGFLGADLYSKDRAVLELIDEASSDLGSRFFVRIREEMGLAYFVGSSSVQGLVRGPFVFYLGTDPAKVEAVEKVLMAEIQDLAANGLSAVELERAKEKLIGQQDIRNQSNDSFAFAAALDELYGLGFDHYRELRRRVDEVTLEDVKRVANTYFLNQPPIVVLARPAPGPVSSEPA